MIPSDYVIIESYMMDPENDSNIFNLITRGLKVIREFTIFYPKDKLYTMIQKCEQPLLKHLLAHGCLIDIIESAATYKDLKQQMGMFANQFRPAVGAGGAKKVPQWNLTFIDYIESLIYDTRVHQKETKALEESVVCAYSPIVPYVGTLKKPFNGERYEDDPEVLAKASTEGWSNLELFKLWNASLEIMTNMVMNHKIVDELLLNNEMIRPDEFKASDAASMKGLAQTMDNNPKFKNHRAIIAFMLWAFVHEYADSMEFEEVYAMSSMAREASKKSFDDLFNDALSHTPATEAELLSELDNFDALNKFMKKPDEYMNTNTSSDPIRLFNLTSLMNFIFTNRRFRANKYTNMAFMNMPRIGSATYYKNFVIIQPESIDGNDVNYLYVPVIDDLNGSQVVVLKFWRNEHIDILTETEYREETQGLGV